MQHSRATDKNRGLQYIKHYRPHGTPKITARAFHGNLANYSKRWTFYNHQGRLLAVLTREKAICVVTSYSPIKIMASASNNHGVVTPS